MDREELRIPPPEKIGIARDCDFKFKKILRYYGT